MSAFRQPLTAARQHVERFAILHRRWIVLAMLLALHAALSAEAVGAFTRVWLLVHFGFFLLWQPFFSRARAIDPFAALLLLVITAATVYFVSGWILVTWLLVLLGILGGRVFTLNAGRRNLFYLVAFAYVLALLLLWAVPRLLLAESIPEGVAIFARALLPWVLIALAVLPADAEIEDAGAVFDFFYAVLVFQLAVVLVLGAVALMRFTGRGYFASVALAALAFGVALFVLAVLWNPLRGFGGLRTYFSRYLLSVGTPFELWMRRIAMLAESEADPRRFLELAVDEVARLPWVRGGRWRVGDEHGTFGHAEGHATRFEQHGLELTFHTEVPLSPALLLHMRLLAQVIGEFHEGKRREAALRRNAYLQAVHETGARLTHDVKNLLQS
ncbi:MAG: sensor histidine kinase, partial [Bacillota bacterium]